MKISLENLINHSPHYSHQVCALFDILDFENPNLKILEIYYIIKMLRASPLCNNYIINKIFKRKLYEKKLNIILTIISN